MKAGGGGGALITGGGGGAPAAGIGGRLFSRAFAESSNPCPKMEVFSSSSSQSTSMGSVGGGGATCSAAFHGAGPALFGPRGSGIRAPDVGVAEESLAADLTGGAPGAVGGGGPGLEGAGGGAVMRRLVGGGGGAETFDGSGTGGAARAFDGPGGAGGGTETPEGGGMRAPDGIGGGRVRPEGGAGGPFDFVATGRPSSVRWWVLDGGGGGREDGPALGAGFFARPSKTSRSEPRLSLI